MRGALRGRRQAAAGGANNSEQAGSMQPRRTHCAPRLVRALGAGLLPADVLQIQAQLAPAVGAGGDDHDARGAALQRGRANRRLAGGCNEDGHAADKLARRREDTARRRPRLGLELGQQQLRERKVPQVVGAHLWEQGGRGGARRVMPLPCSRALAACSPPLAPRPTCISKPSAVKARGLSAMTPAERNR